MSPFFKSLILTAFSGGLCLATARADSFHTSNTVVLPFPLFPNSACLPGYVNICGKNVATPGGPLGSFITLNVPSPYMHQPFTAQCVVINNLATYLITDASRINCTLESCPASSVHVCGADIPVPVQSTVGSEVEVTVPRSLLVPDAVNTTFTAACVDNGETGVYQIKDALNFSCNQFPCQPSYIRLCETSVPIPGGATMGEVLHLEMPPPFKPDPFAVQCLGTMNQAPAYQLMYHDNITCDRLPTSP